MQETVKLRITHHAMERAGWYHPELRGLVPSSIGKALSYDEAFRSRKMANIMVRALRHGLPVAMGAAIQGYKRWRYGTCDFYFLETGRKDLYTMVYEPPEVVVITVTNLVGKSCGDIRHDVAPIVRKEMMLEIDEVILPYALGFDRIPDNLLMIPCGKECGWLKVSFERRPVDDLPKKL